MCLVLQNFLSDVYLYSTVWDSGALVLVLSTNFGTHVANSCHTRAGERLNTRTSVFDDGTGTALHCENTSNLENNIYKSNLFLVSQR